MQITVVATIPIQPLSRDFVSMHEDLFVIVNSSNRFVLVLCFAVSLTMLCNPRFDYRQRTGGQVT